MQHTKIRMLTVDYLKDITKLTQQLNPDTSISVLQERQKQMFTFDNYRCFGIFNEEKLVGLSSGWILVKLYSGKQLEVDNLIIDNSIQSKGFGKVFLNYIEDWAKQNNCKTVELNTYVQNNKSHKFYFNQGYRILGFHFEKQLN